MLKLMSLKVKIKSKELTQIQNDILSKQILEETRFWLWQIRDLKM